MTAVVNAYHTDYHLWLVLCTDPMADTCPGSGTGDDPHHSHIEYPYPWPMPPSFPGDADTWQQYCLQDARYRHEAYERSIATTVAHPHLVG